MGVFSRCVELQQYSNLNMRVPKNMAVILSGERIGHGFRGTGAGGECGGLFAKYSAGAKNAVAVFVSPVGCGLPARLQ